MELGPEAEHQKAVQGVQKVLFVHKALLDAVLGSIVFIILLALNSSSLHRLVFLLFLISPIWILFLPYAFKGERQSL